jgi:hypothetical protein
MATVNLGAIKFKWKGTYNALTAYTIDDVVSYNGSSYICISNSTGNLPTNATYFEQMSQAGTNGTDGTDLTTTLTTQGDIVYRNASGLARLGAGNSGEFLKTQGTGANPVWAEAGGGLVASATNVNTYQMNSTSSSYVDVESSSGTTWEIAYTPSSASNKLLLLPSIPFRNVNSSSGDARGAIQMHEKIGSGSYSIIHRNYEFGGYDYGQSGTIHANTYAPMMLRSPNTTSEVKYKFQIRNEGGTSVSTGWGNSNFDYDASVLNQGHKSHFTILELKV